ncbi:hypothetical protein BU24DRAFT_477246 [Aaosphaeria arxii CBS 175.79]|uniref:Uncharacterized protein n=1 Tax=Aaosphaeria arxii CBS 175.79 TaxID=1450172 RepID=A0A6A5Y3I8_9PLEO|nr:uncharacterized protein BU24DRAFT_477246 [Aaosphaeria arxii CBS 175.79]KAF2020102.1 hypothetical protein BU24DRAFT_477246 [Aaosphaeria arxii CBS 175.79]
MDHSLSEEWKYLKEDLGHNKWQRIFFGIVIMICTWGLMLSIWFLGAITANSNVAQDSACTPDGKFRLDPYSYNYWDISGTFQITLPFGNFSFSSVKSIDIACDVIVGRGGQALLALCSWRVFALYVTTSMEVKPVTYGSFGSIFIQFGPSVSSIGGLVRDFTFRKSLHSKIAMIFIIASMAFILSFPTLASAMTGYTGFVKSYVPDPQTGNFIRFDQLRPVAYIIHDGERIKQNETFFVTDGFISGDPYLGTRGYCVGTNTSIKNPECDLLNSMNGYLRALNKTDNDYSNITFMGIALGNLPLNVTILPPYHNTDYEIVPRPLYENNRMWRWSNETFDLDYNYKWGFSFVQLFCMVVMLLIWSIGILAMRIQARSTLRRRGRESIAGRHKAVIQLAAAMQEHMGDRNLMLESLDEIDLERRIKEVQGGAISYAFPTSGITRSQSTTLRYFRAWFCVLAIIRLSKVDCDQSWLILSRIPDLQVDEVWPN